MDNILKLCVYVAIGLIINVDASGSASGLDKPNLENRYVLDSV
jgi:hypothetical protein